uniref:PH domain-containing protein n=1 Tax=Anabas testudineus TaxID=64144 RepID=A0A3Q1H8P2_ANATE
MKQQQRNMALLRSASVLKRWKLNWCDLWIDGSLCFYKTDSRRELEHRISLKTACVDVRSGLECGGVTPPESNPRENLIVVQLKDGSTVHLCANSEDESIAWKLTLLETRRNPVSDECTGGSRGFYRSFGKWSYRSTSGCVFSERTESFHFIISVFMYDPYDDSYQAVPLNSYQTVYITPGAGPGTHHVVVQRDPFDGVADHLALGLLAGMAAGAAMRSFLWMPFFFC